MTCRRFRNPPAPITAATAVALMLVLPVAAWSDTDEQPAAPEAIQEVVQEIAQDAAQEPVQETTETVQADFNSARLQVERDLLRAEVERLRVVLDDAARHRLERQLAEANARAERLDARLASLLELSHTMEAERNAMRAEVGEERTRAEAAEARVKYTVQERESALETNLALQAQKRDAESRLETQMQRVADQLLQIEALQAELVSAHEAVRTLDAQRAEAHAWAEDLEQRLAECFSGKAHGEAEEPDVAPPEAGSD